MVMKKVKMKKKGSDKSKEESDVIVNKKGDLAVVLFQFQRNHLTPL